MSTPPPAHAARRGKRRARASGFTLFELAVVVAIIGVLGAALLTRIVFYQEQAEIAAVDQVVGALRSALHLKLARMVISGTPAEMRKLQDDNPMEWLAERPKNYAGEYYEADGTTVAAGNWYFNKKGKVLVYLLNNANSSREAAPKLLKFKVRLLTSEANVTNTHSMSGILEGVVLEQVTD